MALEGGLFLCVCHVPQAHRLVITAAGLLPQPNRPIPIAAAQALAFGN